MGHRASRARDSVSPVNMEPASRFQADERVLCSGGPLLYEAKCIKVLLGSDPPRYLVHYRGWNKGWDQWVPETRLLKYDDANLQKKKELEETYLVGNKDKPGAIPKKKVNKTTSSTFFKKRPQRQKATATTVAPSVSSSQPSTSQAANPGGGRQQMKRRCRVTKAVPGETMSRSQFRVLIPDELKHWLKDDGYLVTRQKMLVQVPCSLTVDRIMGDYVKEKISATEIASEKKVIIEVGNGLKKYFDVMLGSQLLFKFERPQYADILQERRGTPMSQIYGAIHLLRMFVRLDTMLRTLPLEKTSAEHFVAQIHDFLKYMVENSQQLFTLDVYDTATVEYLRRALYT